MMSITLIITIVLGVIGSLITFLMSALVYLTKKMLSEQQYTNRNNTSEHKKFNASIIKHDSKMQQIDVNTSDIKALDDRVDKHDMLLNG